MTIKSAKTYSSYDKTKTKKAFKVKVLKANEIDIIDTIDNVRDKGILNFLLHTGLRVAELCSIDYGTVFSDMRRKILHDYIYIIGKGKKNELFL